MHPVKYKTKQKRRCPDTFKQYTKHLPLWERQLLTHWKHITDGKELKKQTLLHKIFYYVTDGGYNDGIGHLGWLITTETKILTKGYGQALGSEHQMESLCAETYDGIAVIDFITLLSSASGRSTRDAVDAYIRYISKKPTGNIWKMEFDVFHEEHGNRT
eukprot:14912826-Ditylum_brightwellii.AAC.1